MNKVGVSVILPTYNRAQRLGAAIDSVLGQTYQTLELIVVDDGSEDETQELVRAYDDPRIRYFRLKKNGGPAKARNYGIQMAQYEYIAFEDSDDLWFDNKLEAQMAVMLENPDIDFVYHKLQYEAGEGQYYILPRTDIPLEKKSGHIFNQLLQDNLVGVPTLLVKKVCLEKVGGFHEDYAALEDYVLILDLARDSLGAFIDEIYLEADLSDPNSVSKHTGNYFAASYQMLLEFKYDYKQQGLYDAKLEKLNREASKLGIERQFQSMKEQIKKVSSSLAKNYSVQNFHKLNDTFADEFQNAMKQYKGDKDVECLTKLQQILVDYGNALEKDYPLENTEIIRLIEDCCEACYLESIDGQNFPRPFREILELYADEISRQAYDSLPQGAHELSVVAIVRDEKYIREWIAYHRLVGVSHFYIYDNESQSDLKKELWDYISSGIVTYNYWPGEVVQLWAYEDAIIRYRFETRYMAIIDADEYIVPVEGKTIPDVIAEIGNTFYQRKHKEFGRFGGIGINWRCYGTSHHKLPPEGLCIENYMYRANDHQDKNVHVKSVINPRTVADTENTHCFKYKKGYFAISENGGRITNAYLPDGRCEKLRINHYFSKSEKELLDKLKRGWADLKHVQLSDAYIQRELKVATEDANEIYDPIMERYIEQVKQQL